MQDVTPYDLATTGRLGNLGVSPLTIAHIQCIGLCVYPLDQLFFNGLDGWARIGKWLGIT
jgi:hypothetical protein